MAYLCWGNDDKARTPRLCSFGGSNFERRLKGTTVMVACEDGLGNTGPPVGSGALVEGCDDRQPSCLRGFLKSLAIAPPHTHSASKASYRCRPAEHSG